MKLMIVESPHKKQTIQKYLGSEWRVEASVGHLCDLPLKALGVSAPTYQPQYELTERGERTLIHLKAAAKQAESVWLATDPDREGEAIAGHLERLLKRFCKTVYRVVFHEITEKAVHAAITAPRNVNRALCDAQQARRVIDRLVGYRVSPALSRAANQALSAGRVQSLALRLLVERERSIRNFNPTKHYGVRLHFKEDGIAWFADWDPAPFLNDARPYILEPSLLKSLKTLTEVVVVDRDVTTHHRKAPPPFITTTLQKAASLRLNLKADETMRLAQLLFENGLITYHRTDNPNLSMEALCAIQTELARLNFGEQIANPPNRWKASSNAQEAHEAIRPSHLARVASGLEPKAQQLYELVRLRALASQLSAAQSEITTVTVAPTDERTIEGIMPQFIAIGVKAIAPGWHALLSQDQSEESSDETLPQNAMPALEHNAALRVQQCEIRPLKTRAPKRYTESALITQLEKAGIGRPSTYATILSTIQKRGYAQYKGKRFETTPTAETIEKALTGRFAFMEVDYTQRMEQALDDIARGKQDYQTVVAWLDHDLQQSLQKLERA